MNILKTLCILLIAVAIAGCKSDSLNDREPLRATSYYSESDIKDIVEVIMDELPSTTGRSLRKVPELNFVSAQEIADIVFTDHADLSEEARQKKWANAQLYSKAVGAIYRYETESVYIVPDNIRLLAQDQESAEDSVYYHLLVLITHELIHALQHQEIGFDRLKAINRTKDQRLASRLIVEGHAELQTALVLKGMGLIQEVEAYIKSEKPIKSDGDEDKQHAYDREMAKIYIKGKQFFDYHYQRGGNERAWNILINPPKSSDLVFNPEQFSLGVQQ